MLNFYWYFFNFQNVLFITSRNCFILFPWPVSSLATIIIAEINIRIPLSKMNFRKFPPGITTVSGKGASDWKLLDDLLSDDAARVSHRFSTRRAVRQPRLADPADEMAVLADEDRRRVRNVEADGALQRLFDFRSTDHLHFGTGFNLVWHWKAIKKRSVLILS